MASNVQNFEFLELSDVSEEDRQLLRNICKSSDDSVQFVSDFSFEFNKPVEVAAESTSEPSTDDGTNEDKNIERNSTRTPLSFFVDGGNFEDIDYEDSCAEAVSIIPGSFSVAVELPSEQLDDTECVEESALQSLEVSVHHSETVQVTVTGSATYPPKITDVSAIQPLSQAVYGVPSHHQPHPVYAPIPHPMVQAGSAPTVVVANCLVNFGYGGNQQVPPTAVSSSIHASGPSPPITGMYSHCIPAADFSHMMQLSKPIDGKAEYESKRFDPSLSYQRGYRRGRGKGSSRGRKQREDHERSNSVSSDHSTYSESGSTKSIREPSPYQGASVHPGMQAPVCHNPANVMQYPGMYHVGLPPVSYGPRTQASLVYQPHFIPPYAPYSQSGPPVSSAVVSVHHIQNPDPQLYCMPHEHSCDPNVAPLGLYMMANSPVDHGIDNLIQLIDPNINTNLSFEGSAQSSVCYSYSDSNKGEGSISSLTEKAIESSNEDLSCTQTPEDQSVLCTTNLDSQKQDCISQDSLPDCQSNCPVTLKEDKKIEECISKKDKKNDGHKASGKIKTPAQSNDAKSQCKSGSNKNNSSQAFVKEDSRKSKNSNNETTAASVTNVWSGNKNWAQVLKSDEFSGKQVALVTPFQTEDSKKVESNLLTKASSPATESDEEKIKIGAILKKYAQDYHHFSLQPRGLINKGYWCYVNAPLQALLACPPFFNLIKAIPSFSLKKCSSPVLDSIFDFVQEFVELPEGSLHKASQKEKGGVIPDIDGGLPFEPQYVYKMLAKISGGDQFAEGCQQDAEEMLSCVLNGLHDELVEALKLAGINEKSDSADASATHAVEEISDSEEEWKVMGPGRKSCVTRTAAFSPSPISDIFWGQLRSVLHQAGGRITANLQPFTTLPLDIQSNKVESVKDALEHLVTREDISDFTCSRTNQEVSVSKQVMLEHLPAILVLQLKRFVYCKDGGLQKVTKKIDFSVDLEISKDLMSTNSRGKFSSNQRKYKLMAVICHDGQEATKGHYIADIYHNGYEGWLRYDDSCVTSVSEVTVLRHFPPRVPYLLFYRRVDTIVGPKIKK